MGYIRHNAIIATTWRPDSAGSLVEYARGLRMEAVAGDKLMNGYITVCINPDGSKEGWEDSNYGDQARERIKDWIRAHEDMWEWCEVAYGHDDHVAAVTDSAWMEDK